MPNINSYADLVRDWELLLRAFEDNASALSSADPQRLVLQSLLDEAKDVKARQDSAAALRQQLTQELSEVLRQGREQARRLRGLAKGFLGTRNERLVQFKVAPIRTRSRLPQKPDPTSPPENPGPEVAPADPTPE